MYSPILPLKLLWISAESQRCGIQDCGIQDWQAGLNITLTDSVFAAVACILNDDFDVILATLPLGDASACHLIEEVQRTRTLAPFVIHSPGATLDDAVKFAKLGAYQVVGDASDIA